MDADIWGAECHLIVDACAIRIQWCMNGLKAKFVCDLAFKPGMTVDLVVC